MTTQDFSRNMNREFRVCVRGFKLSTWVGFTGLCGYVGEKTAIEAISRALSSSMDKYTWRLRRGLRIDFYVK